MNIIKDINPSRVTPYEFISVIEISKGSNLKYEIDQKTGILTLNRVLYTSSHYPQNYGFIPLTLAEDGDQLDVLVMCQEPINPLTLVKCFPIGVVEMVDQGIKDKKIISICYDDPDLLSYTDINELPVHIFEEIKNFFEIYKQLEGKETLITNILNRKEAEKTIYEAMERLKKSQNEKK